MASGHDSNSDPQRNDVASPSGASRSIWTPASNVGSQPQLTGDTDADVCIVGAGIAGMTTAYLLARENLNVIAQYSDQFTGGDVESVEEIANGTGSVVRRGLTKIAVYRDEQGVLHEHSAVCPHLGCIVGWNSAEKTWDCPCHGSRFDGYGRVLNGPAIRELPRVEPLQPIDQKSRKAAR